MKNLRKDVIEYGIVFLVMLIFAGIFHMDTVKSGFEFFPGDDCDAFLNILAADSWSDVFSGKIPFRQNRIYYPFPAGRGFTDLSLSLYLFELPWRALGAGLFSSAMIVYQLLFHFGILSMLYLLRKVLHLNFAVSIGGAFLCFYSNGCFTKLLHTQFFFAGLLPLLFICTIRYCQLWSSDKACKRTVYGVSALLSFAAIAYSNYYTAFFFALAAGIYFIVYAILLAKKQMLKKVLLVKRIPEVSALAMLGVVLFVPFFYTYLPLTTDEYIRVWTAAQGTLPTLADIVNVGPQNLLWGKLYDALFPSIHKYVYENQHGLPLITAGVFIFCLFRYYKERKNFRPAFTALVITLAVLYVISLKFAHCISLWYFVWKFIPGGSAIRAAGRIYVFMYLPLMVFICYILNRCTRVFPRRKQLAICAGLFILLVADNVNTMSIYQWKPSETIAKIKVSTLPPQEMKCFFVTCSEKAPVNQSNWAMSGLQAWFIARQFSSFTINGYSGNTPANFSAVDPWEPSYRQNISEWVKRHSLDGVFSFNIDTGKWQKEHF